MSRCSVIAVSLITAPLFALGQNTGTSSSSQTTPSKVATVNFNAAVLATEEAQHDLAALQSKYSPREAQLQKLNDSVEAEKKQLSIADKQLSDTERNSRIQDLNNKEKQLQREAEDFRNDSQSDSQQIFQRVAQKFFPLLQEYSRQHGYALVVERGTDANPVVWYSGSDIDITKQVAKAYDARFGKSALPDSPASTTPGAASKAPRVN